jgi:hypothetical protein
MTNEEWDRKTEFLLNQQAKFDADMQELQEAQAANEKKIAEAAEIGARAAETASHAAEATLHVSESVTKLADTVGNFVVTTHEGFRKVFDNMKHTDEKINVLIDSQIRTDERFERHLREDHEDPNDVEH